MTWNIFESLIGIPAVWVATCMGLGWLGGWTHLARAYPARPRTGGRRFRFQNGRMRFRSGYGSCLTVGADPFGLHLSILFLFRPGHPPVFVPWSDVSLHEGSRHGVALTFARTPKVPLILSKHLAGELAEASGGRFAYPRASADHPTHGPAGGSVAGRGEERSW